MICPRCGTPMSGGVCPECGFPITVLFLLADEAATHLKPL